MKKLTPEEIKILQDGMKRYVKAGNARFKEWSRPDKISGIYKLGFDAYDADEQIQEIVRQMTFEMMADYLALGVFNRLKSEGLTTEEQTQWSEKHIKKMHNMQQEMIGLMEFVAPCWVKKG